MMKRLFAYFSFMMLMTLSQTLLANSGKFFNIIGSGTPATLAITLCLDGRNSLSCQNYTVNNLTLQISTRIPNHIYPTAGIKINNTGYILPGCITTRNGFCLFSVSDTSTNTINIASLPIHLSANVSSLALRTNGLARQLIITNSGVLTAANVTYSLSSALPAGTTISPASCGAIVPASKCILTITPGATPSAAPGDINPTPIIFTISGSNTNTLTLTINILTYGSVYQFGYIFSIDDTVPVTGSIGGKVVSLIDQVPFSLSSIIWSSNGTVRVVDRANITGIDETSIAGPNSCNGNNDGACNSQRIRNYYLPTTSFPLSFYAAGVCSQMIDGYSDWYLPAICEMGYDTLGIGSGCGTAVSPSFQNIQSNLIENGNIGSISGPYWSSTEYTKLFGNPTDDAWVQTFGMGSSQQTGSDKSINFAVRCVRALTS